MRFASKMIALMAVLLAVSLSAGGFWVVRSACRLELDNTVREAQEDMKLFGTTLQALCLMENASREPEEAVKRAFQNGSAFGTYQSCVYDENGKLLTGAGEPYPEERTEEDVGIIETRILQRGDTYVVVSSQKMRLMDRTFGITRSREVTQVVHRAYDHLRRYELIMAAVLAAGMALTTLLTLWMTRPIRSIARGVRAFSEGKLEERIAVQTDDELGGLAREFNRMAGSLQEKVGELEDAARRQKDFTASFAHELKTPLTSVIGYADTLRSRELPRRQQIEAANYIFSEGKRLEDLSRALLDLFALERKAPQMRPADARQLAAETEQSLSYLLKTSGLRLVSEAEPARLICEPELIRVLLYNLIDNARKASSPGGVIELRGIRTVREDGTDGYRFTVTDHGTGIPPEVLGRLTEPFYMVDKSRAREKGGAGLGLTLCQKIAEVHGGSLTFESVPGEGTTVCAEIGGAAS